MSANKVSMSALKALYVSTGVAGFLMSPIPVLNIAGAGMIRLANKALEQYELLYIKEILAMDISKVAELFDVAMSNCVELKDPKIYIALALGASNNSDELDINLGKVAKVIYEGMPSITYDGKDRFFEEDLVIILKIKGGLPKRVALKL